MSAIPNQKFYLTTPIYYVNARPHIGHAYSTIVADVLARRHRLLGDDTYFLTGTDEHGQKIERSAAAAGIPPQQFADQVSASFESLWKRMGITNTDFIRTTEPRHQRGAQQLFRTLYERGQIYLSSYTGQYCVSEEMFVEGPPGTIGPDGRPTETVTEENFFFRLSDYGEQLQGLIESGTLNILPDSSRNEVLSFIRGGLKDLSVSRSSFTWGIPVPEDIRAAAGARDPHVIYVWLDALANYMTAVGYGSDTPEAQAMFARYWPADLHLVGKEITRFHCVYWPAFLLAAGLPLPKSVVANGWLLFDNSKMSKSKGNVVRTETILEGFGEVYRKGIADFNAAQLKKEPGFQSVPEPTKPDQDLFATDVLRYFLLREIPFGQDGSFSLSSLRERYNSELTNGYGNLTKRVLDLILAELGGQIPEVKPELRQPIVDSEAQRLTGFSEVQRILQSSGADPRYQHAIADYTMEHAPKALDSYDFSRALELIWILIKVIDGYITVKEPWKLSRDPSKRDELLEVLYTAAESIRIITALLYPFMPYSTGKVWKQLGFEGSIANGDLKNLQWGGLEPGTKLGPLSPIFPRADKGLAQIMAETEANASALIPTDSSAEPGLPVINNSVDARTSEATEFIQSPLADVVQPTPLSPGAADPPYPNEPPAPSRLTGETTNTAAPDNYRSTAPDAGPRSLAEPNPIAHVAGAAAPSPDLPRTPSHIEAPASGLFANRYTSAPVLESEAAAPAPTATPQITIDDFAKVELRVAQILSGIAEWYTPEDLIGRRIVVITNLASRKMRGLESHGMLLAASDGDHGKPVLATMAEEIALGSRLK